MVSGRTLGKKETANSFGYKITRIIKCYYYYYYDLLYNLITKWFLICVLVNKDAKVTNLLSSDVSSVEQFLQQRSPNPVETHTHIQKPIKIVGQRYTILIKRIKASGIYCTDKDLSQLERYTNCNFLYKRPFTNRHAQTWIKYLILYNPGLVMSLEGAL